MKYIQDAFDFIRRSQSCSGQASIIDFERLAIDYLAEQSSCDLIEETAPIDWQITSELTATGEYLLCMRVRAELALHCQSCFEPVLIPIDSTTTVQIVSRFEDLDEVDASGQIADAPYEKVVATPVLDIMQLVEDELLLSLPYVPRHDACDVKKREDFDALAPSLEFEQADEKPSPFAILEKLKKN